MAYLSAELTRLIDPLSLLLVCGGTLAVTALRSTREDMGRALRAVPVALRARPTADAARARGVMKRVARTVELKGIACADRVDGSCPFVAHAAVQLANAASADQFAGWAEEELADRAARHAAAAAVWRAAAEAAPAMGMIGTVLGLIGMFAGMEDASRMGGAMAMAMLTTLYGLVLGAGVAGPVAGRLETLAAAERHWQAAVLARLEALARAEPVLTREWLRERAPAQP